MQATYSVGLKGVSDGAKCAEIEQLVLATLMKVHFIYISVDILHSTDILWCSFPKKASTNQPLKRLSILSSSAFASLILAASHAASLSCSVHCQGQVFAFKYGSHLDDTSDGSWLYDRDPLEPLRIEEPLAKLRSRLASGEPVFEKLIQKYLLDNGHRVSVKVRCL